MNTVQTKIGTCDNFFAFYARSTAYFSEISVPEYKLVCLGIEKTNPFPAHHWPQTRFKERAELFQVQETATSIASEAFPPQSPDSLSFSFIIASHSGHNSKIIEWEFENDLTIRQQTGTRRKLYFLYSENTLLTSTLMISVISKKLLNSFTFEAPLCTVPQYCGNQGTNPLLNYFALGNP